jgi:hypothetical protein
VRRTPSRSVARTAGKFGPPQKRRPIRHFLAGQGGRERRGRHRAGAAGTWNRAIGEPTKNDLTAYDLYLRAWHHALSYDKGRIDQALDLLERAAAFDPGYGPALVLAVYCHQQLQVSGWAEDREANRRTAIDLARRAVQIATDDPTALGQAALVLGYFGEDINVALALIDRALALNPSSARAWYWSGVLRVLSARRRLVERAAEIGKSWGELPRTRQRTFLTTLIERIDVATTQIDVHLRPTRLGDLPEVAAVPSPGAIEGETQILSVPVQLRRFGREIKLLIDGTDPFATTKPNPRLIKLLIRARRLNAILARGNGVPLPPELSRS